MEEQQRSLIFTASVGLIILAIIVGSVYYLVKFIQGRVASSRQTPQASVQTIAQSSPNGGSVQGEQISPDAQGNDDQPPPQIADAGEVTMSPDSGKKVYNSGDFQLSYPKNWGILMCTNSKNIELDPNNNADSKIACGTAIKPVTVLVSDIKGCEGGSIKIGNVDVIKSKKTLEDYAVYRWCTKTTPSLNITHRVSKTRERATSKEDYSKEVEEMIKGGIFTK